MTLPVQDDRDRVHLLAIDLNRDPTCTLRVGTTTNSVKRLLSATSRVTSSRKTPKAVSNGG